MKQVIYFVTAAVVLIPDLALACSVCYGDPESPLTKGLEMGVFVLLGVIGAVLFCFAWFFVTLWRKERSHNLIANRNDA